MNKILFISAALLVIVGSYFLWTFYHQNATRSWDLVPKEALIAFAYHKNSTNDPTERLIKPFLPDSIRKILLEANELLVSAHVINNEIGVVLYLPVSALTEKKIISLLQSGRAYRERIFDGFTIIESSVNGSHPVSAVMINGIGVISSTSLLIEDVIRLAELKESRNFILEHQALLQFAQTKPDSANVYIDLSRLLSFFNLFLSSNTPNPILSRFAQSALVESKRQNQNLLLSGFAMDSLSPGGSVLSMFNRQRPVPVKLQQIVSNRAGILVHFGITDFALWSQDRLRFCKTTAPWVADSMSALNTRKGFDTDQFYQTFDDEMGVCQSGVFSGEIFIVEVKNRTGVASLLKKLDRKKKPDQLSEENFSHYQIHFLGAPSLPRTLFWPLTNRNMSYYLITDHHLIFSEKLEDLKAFVSDLDNESTWGKSSEWNEFLSTSQDTNVGIIFDGLNWWPSLRTSLRPKWQAYGDSTHFMNFEKGSFQFSRLEKSYYFNGVLKFNKNKPRLKREEREKLLEIILPQPISSALTMVRNHTTEASELLVQDQSNSLKLFSSGFKNLFSTTLNGKIKTAVHQIDFYKNKKLQYLFATDRNLFLIDRLGNVVDGFPKLISGSNPIQFITVIDYDHTKNYRFLISDTKGTIILYDREGNIIPDWKKAELNTELWVAPRAVRTMGKDYLIAITRDGMVHCFNRKGEPIHGFPVNLKLRPMGNWVFEKTGDLEVITVISDDGVVEQVDLRGEIISRTNLPKSSAASRFALAPLSDFDHYAISRIDKAKMAVLNNKGDVLFEKENPGSDELFLTYFATGRGRKLFCFTDPQQEFTYFFDETGKSVFSRPLESQGVPVIMSERSGEVSMYCVNKNKIQSYRPGSPAN